MSKRINGRQDHPYIERREEFASHGSLRGQRPEGMNNRPETGELPKPWADLFREHTTSGDVTYIVWSYSTPIAWEHAGIWYRPAVTYSTTTSKHQSQCPIGVSRLPGESILYRDRPDERRRRFNVVSVDHKTGLTLVERLETTSLGVERHELSPREVHLGESGTATAVRAYGA